jgi:hypothetical protein
MKQPAEPAKKRLPINCIFSSKMSIKTLAMMKQPIPIARAIEHNFRESFLIVKFLSLKVDFE